MNIYKVIGRIRRKHGIKGAMLLEIYKDSWFDGMKMLQDSFDAKIPLKIDDNLVVVSRIFGKVKNLCRIEIEGCDINTANELRSKEILAEYNGIDYDQLIDCAIKDKNTDKKLCKIEGIFNFGAGIVVDTTKEMFGIDMLDITDAKKGVVYLKS